MKNIYLILSVFAVIFIACETDFDVNATWEEVVVVYGLLDTGEGKELQQIKISKAFLGEMDALQMAQYADSINFDPNDLDVKIVRIRNNGNTDTISLVDSTIIRESGIFNETIIIYKFVNDDFLKSDSEYELVIKNLISGNKVTSNKTRVIGDFSFLNFNSAYPFGFYNSSLADSLKFKSKTIEWQDVYEGEIYQLDVRFHYKENGISRSLVWSQPLVSYDGRSMSSKLEGAKFFNFLRNYIIKDNTNTISRSFENLDLVMTVGTADLNTYIKVNEPITGIVQERPHFTNINNGIGIFSSRYTYTEYNIGLSDETKQFLIEELDRNFQ